MNLNEQYIVVIETMETEIPRQCSECQHKDMKIYTENSIEGAYAKKYELLQKTGILSARIFKQIQVEVVEKELPAWNQENSAKLAAGAEEN